MTCFVNKLVFLISDYCLYVVSHWKIHLCGYRNGVYVKVAFMDVNYLLYISLNEYVSGPPIRPTKGPAEGSQGKATVMQSSIERFSGL